MEPESYQNIRLARFLNRTLGTNLAPWELDAVPELDLAVIVESLLLESEMKSKGFA